MKPMWIGMDIGGTNLRLGVFTSEPVPSLLEEMRFQADFTRLCLAHSHAPEQAWQRIVRTIAEAITRLRSPYPDVVGVGIGFPGFIDPATQKILSSPNLPGLNQVDLSADLSLEIGLPVWTVNDALAAAYGEYALRAQQIDSLIYLGLGTGVGGGMVLAKQPIAGQHGVAMEVGHLIIKPQGRLCGCGNRGCMEQYASASGVARTYAELTGMEGLDAALVAAFAREGDARAIHAYERAGDALAQALATILKVLDASRVIIGGGMSLSWGLMKPAFDKRLDADLIPALRGKVEVCLSESGDQAGIVGAAMLAEANRG